MFSILSTAKPNEAPAQYGDISLDCAGGVRTTFWSVQVATLMRTHDRLSPRLAFLLVLLGTLSVAGEVISLSYTTLIAFRVLTAVFQVIFVASMIVLVVWRLFVGVPTQLSGRDGYWSGTRIAPNNRCAKCGYDLTGNTSGVCPECGIPISKDIRRPLDRANRVDPRLSMIGFGGFSAVCCAGVFLAILFANQLRSLGIVLAIMCGWGALVCLVDLLSVRSHQRRKQSFVARNGLPEEDASRT